MRTATIASHPAICGGDLLLRGYPGVWASPPVTALLDRIELLLELRRVLTERTEAQSE